MIALAVIAAVAGVALSGVYSLTKEPIEQQELQKKRAAYKDVCPDADTFEQLDAAEALIAGQDEKANARINEFYAGKTAGGELAGYALGVTAKGGFGGDITMAIGLTPEGKIIKISFIELNETKGYGKEADTDAFKDQFVGKGGELAYGPDLNAVSGATFTSKAVMNGINSALTFCETATKGGN